MGPEVPQMREVPGQDRLASHEVTNQPAPRGDLDLWAGDPALGDHAAAAGADAARLADFGARIGTAGMRALGREANRHPPEAVLFDAGGRRLDELRFHPAYHRLMETGIGAGYAALPWEGAAGGHATHAAMVYLMSQVEPGVCCPMTMTYAAVPALRADKAIFAQWVPKLTARLYDPAARPLARKGGATMGMAMTEKQGSPGINGSAPRPCPTAS
jgi:putative acyl-CoA dehydrogenase